MNQPSSTVIQPTHTFRIQLSPDTAAEASYSTLTKADTGYASPSSYTFQAFFDGEPLLRETTSLNLDRLARADAKQLSPISLGAMGTLLPRRASEAIFRELGELIQVVPDRNDGYVRVPAPNRWPRRRYPRSALGIPHTAGKKRPTAGRR